jgi:hypothetical protein
MMAVSAWKAWLLLVVIGLGLASPFGKKGHHRAHNHKKPLVAVQDVPVDLQAVSAPDEDAFVPRHLDHWAFQPIVPVSIPKVSDGGWGRNPIDAFIAAGLAAKSLTPTAPADRALLLRRVSIDLVGLPPTREELQAFLADQSPDAYEKVVERLLASPRYGERWARHWMDIWRYSEADGRKAKADIWWSSAHLWRWRDWIIESLNRDVGYDRMIKEMLAGDESPTDAGSLAATGFLVRNWFKLDRNVWLNNTVDHTAKAFLGISIGCARCHNHKYDPISQKEYYQFRAFFETHDVRADPLPGAADQKADQIVHACDSRPQEPTWLLHRGDPKSPDKRTPLLPGTPAALGAPAPAAAPVAATKSTGRRTALARWITDRRNPLTARVAVNHIWARHFGRPLVENLTDFGVRTPAPRNQALLDWLANEFMDRGWSIKALHRLMVNSATYRMRSSSLGAPAANAAIDPENDCYWRMNSRRMEAEVIRDSLLHLGGVLDTTVGGPPLDHSRGDVTSRRSLYYRYSREDKLEFLTAFDAAGVEECYRRQQSIVPQQALALTNSSFVRDQARRIARRLQADPSLNGSDDEFISAAFEWLIGRQPQAAEVAECARFLKEQTRLLSNPAVLTGYPPQPPPPPPDPEVLKRVPGLPLVLGKAIELATIAPATDPAALARELLIHALLNHNDFITVR